MRRVLRILGPEPFILAALVGGGLLLAACVEWTSSPQDHPGSGVKMADPIPYPSPALKAVYLQIARAPSDDRPEAYRRALESPELSEVDAGLLRKATWLLDFPDADRAPIQK